jgi:hypothetical protein
VAMEMLNFAYELSLSYSLGSLTCKILRHGADGFTSSLKEGVLCTFIILKKSITSAGFQPANLMSSGKHATTRPVKVTLLTRVLTIKQTWNRILKMTVYWDVASCSLVEMFRRFRGCYCLHHQGSGSSPLKRRSVPTNYTAKHSTIDISILATLRNLTSFLLHFRCLFSIKKEVCKLVIFVIQINKI